MYTRTSPLALALTLCAIGACGDEPPASPPSNHGDAATDVVAIDGGDSSDEPSSPEVHGRVLFYGDNQPAPGAKITLVDANASIRLTQSASDGTFTIPSIAVPYAIRVESPDPSFGAAMFDHVTTLKPVLGVGKVSPKAGWALHQIGGQCALSVPVCTGGTCPIGVTVGAKETLTDDAIFDATVTSYSNAGTINLTLAAVWRGQSSSRQVTFDALSSDAGHFNYIAASKTVTLQDGQPFPCGNLALQAVTAPNTSVTTVNFKNVPSAMTRSAGIGFSFPSGGALTLFSFPSPAQTIAFGVPSIGLSGYTAAALASDPSNSGQFGYDTKTFAPSAASAEVTAYGPLSPISPGPGGSVSASGSLTWVDGSGAASLVGVYLTRLDDGGQTLLGSITGAQGSLPLQTLAKLGVGLTPGSYKIDIGARRTNVSVDQLLAGPTAPGFDGATGASWTSYNVTVTP